MPSRKRSEDSSRTRVLASKRKHSAHTPHKRRPQPHRRKPEHVHRRGNIVRKTFMGLHSSDIQREEDALWGDHEIAPIFIELMKKKYEDWLREQHNEGISYRELGQILREEVTPTLPIYKQNIFKLFCRNLGLLEIKEYSLDDI